MRRGLGSNTLTWLCSRPRAGRCETSSSRGGRRPHRHLTTIAEHRACLAWHPGDAGDTEGLARMRSGPAQGWGRDGRLRGRAGTEGEAAGMAAAAHSPPGPGQDPPRWPRRPSADGSSLEGRGRDTATRREASLLPAPLPGPPWRPTWPAGASPSSIMAHPPLCPGHRTRICLSESNTTMGWWEGREAVTYEPGP